MYRRSQRRMLIINNRFLSLYDYNFLLVNQRLEKIFLEKPDWKKIWSEISKGWSGTCFLLTSIFTFFLFGEIRNLTTFTRLMDYNNGISLSFFFNLFLSFLWKAKDNNKMKSKKMKIKQKRIRNERALETRSSWARKKSWKPTSCSG